MDEKLPLIRLQRLTWIQTVIIGFIFYLVASNTDKPFHILTYTVLTMCGILLVGYTDIFLMILLARKYSIRSKQFALLRRILSYIISIIIYLLLRPAFGYVDHIDWSFFEPGSFFAFTGSGVVINTMITLLHDSVLLYEHKLYSDLELSRLKAANAEAMNLVLKQQIQPHFLFNALNTLKALYHRDLVTADNYIVHMANFLRASISHHASNIARLDDEINLLNDYLEMQRIRFGKALICEVLVERGILEDFYLPAFSLQPLLENAIKHNNFTQEQPLIIRIVMEDGWLTIINSRQKKQNKPESTKYGLANLAERYRLLSGDEVRIKETPENFSVSIKLIKNEDHDH